MFICKDNKLFIQKGDKIVGVNYNSHEIFEVENIELELTAPFKMLTPHEARCKFNITVDTPYEFPLEKSEEVVDDIEDESSTELETSDVNEPTNPTVVVEKPKAKAGRPTTKK